jgi:glycosyltransferase involved in cell wall biosynthesis
MRIESLPAVTPRGPAATTSTNDDIVAAAWSGLRASRGANWPRRVAIVHYWLVTMRGGERVLESLLRLFPEADIYTHVYDPAGVSDMIRARTVRTTFINDLPGARRHYQKYLPLMPVALEQLDLTGYDLVISSESGPAKGVITGPNTLHLCYVHSPMRYLWDHYHQYRASAGGVTRAAMPWLFNRLRVWDHASAARPDTLVANSKFVRRRIAKTWGRDANVVYPPVSLDQFSPNREAGDYYLWVGQMVPYKRPDLAVDAFNELGIPLRMIGDGPLARKLRSRKRDNVDIISRASFAALKRAYSECKGLIHTAEEDFGIIPVETIASGRPVLAYSAGGALETITDGVSGLFFPDQTRASLLDGIEQMERWLPCFDQQASVASVQCFAPSYFEAGILNALASKSFA